MPRWGSRLVILVVLLICVWGHLSEIADRWDHTLQSGTDSEYSLILLALSAGAVLTLSTQLVGRLRECGVLVLALVCAGPCPLVVSSRIAVTDSSPPLTLRI